MQSTYNEPSIFSGGYDKAIEKIKINDYQKQPM